jgi:hypothetical protein
VTGSSAGVSYACRVNAWYLPFVIAVACSGEREAPRRTPSAPPVPAAAAALASTFAPDVVGKIAPTTPRAGDYAMALTMTYETFPTMEFRINERRTGALRLSLAADGTARACLGSRAEQVVDGQWHYEPPERRQHRSRNHASLLALAGTWKVVDGVATIQFDQLRRATCDLAEAIQVAQPVVALRCIGVGPTDRVPAGSLACEAHDQSDLLGLGMRMTAASRNVEPSPAHPAPDGHNLVLGAPGLVVEVSQDSRAMVPTITFGAGTVTLVEADYQPKK